MDFDSVWSGGRRPSPGDRCRSGSAGPTLRVAFIGNSFTYYNDLVHVVQCFLSENLQNGSVEVGACLRGGSSLVTLWRQGARMRNEQYIGGSDMYTTVKELLSDPAGWDVVILQDHSQGPARLDTRAASVAVLERHYLPLLLAVRTGRPLVVLYQTWGYVQAAKYSEEIGDFEEMTHRLAEGYEVYAERLRAAGLEVITAPVGRAFAQVKAQAPDLWPALYQPDHFHPTALGSFLSAAHLSTAIARHPRFSARFPSGVRLQPLWPSAMEPYRSLPPPSGANISQVLAAAGPAAHAPARRPEEAAAAAGARLGGGPGAAL